MQPAVIPTRDIILVSKGCFCFLYHEFGEKRSDMQTYMYLYNIKWQGKTWRSGMLKPDMDFTGIQTNNISTS